MGTSVNSMIPPRLPLEQRRGAPANAALFSRNSPVASEFTNN